MNKFAAITLIVFLLGAQAFSMPLTVLESDVYAVEIESQYGSDADAAQTEPPPSVEIEERQEESAVLTRLNLFPIENHTRHFFNYTDKILIGAPPDLVIPPNA